MIKSLLTVPLFLSATLFTKAQVIDDSVAMGPGYAQQVFYSMQNGEVASIDASSWDVSFTTDAFDATVMVNDHKGLEAYEYMGDFSDWETLDTTGNLSARLYNSDTDFRLGALNNSASITPNPFDYGWGVYNQVTHVVTGNRIFIIKDAEGNARKFKIESLTFGLYTIVYANLDGTEEQEVTATTSDFTGKNFFYLDMESGSTLDLEPMSVDWDITFTRYNSEIAPDFYYLLSGVLQNKGLRVSEASGISPDMAVWGDYPQMTDKNVIGDDWKYFNMETFQWEIPADLSFFVQDQNDAVWQLIFTGFGGVGTGLVEFSKEMVGVNGLDELTQVQVGLFPNPSEGQVIVEVPQELVSAQWRVIDLNGRNVTEGRFAVSGQNELNLNGLESGIYILQAFTGEFLAQERIVIR